MKYAILNDGKLSIINADNLDAAKQKAIMMVDCSHETIIRGINEVKDYTDSENKFLKDFARLYPEKMDLLEKFLRVLLYGNKADMLNFTNNGQTVSGVDFGRPIMWDDVVKGIGIKPDYYVFDYRGDISTVPLNLCENLFNYLIRELKN